MKYFLAFLVLSLFCSAPLLAENKSVPYIRIGEFSVYPILDRDSAMKAEIFSGPLSQEERLKFMPGGQAPASVNIFLIKSHRGNWLVDCGWGSSGQGENLTAERLQAAGVKLEDIDLVFLTHMHPDHIGGLLEQGRAALPKAELWVDKIELGYWLYGPPAEEKESLQVRLAKAYEGRINEFKPDQEIVPGLTALKAYGHTPGHTVFRLVSKGQEILFVGDIVHAAALQFPNPEECASYDQDRSGAIEARKQILSLAAKGELLIAGAHIPYEGIGRVKEAGQGFSFTPNNYYNIEMEGF